MRGTDFGEATQPVQGGAADNRVPPESGAAQTPPGAATAPARQPTSATTPLPPALCVLGLGLIGGSLMRAASEHLPVFGWSPGQSTRDAATDAGYPTHQTIHDALRHAVDTDALVVLAAPVTAFPELLRRIDDAAPTVTLTDVAGIKAAVAAQVSEIAPRARYIGSHPMTGTAHSGWAAGSADLFTDRVWVTCLDQASRMQDWLPVAGLALTLGSRVVPIEPDAHDDAAARVSHLPHMLALALAQVGRAGGALAMSLAAGSFADATRVAATRPELIRAMCETNAQPLIAALDESLGLLGVARASPASSGSLDKITSAGHAARAAFDDRFAGLHDVVLQGTDMIEQLLAVGAAGGYVTGLSGSGDALTVDAHYPADA